MAVTFATVVVLVLAAVSIYPKTEASPSATRYVVEERIGETEDKYAAILQDIATYADKYEHELYAARKHRKMECGSIVRVSALDCELCSYLVEQLSDLVAKGSTQEDVEKVATEACIGFKIEDDRVCRAVVQEFKASFIDLYI